MSLKFAVILSGCGNKDGSEIHESVSALLAISNLGASYQCFAPNVEFDEINYLTGKPTGKTRNALLEAARIARGNIKDVKQLNPDDFDILVIPGGLGAITTLCNFAEKGSKCVANLDVSKAIKGFHNLNKPIVALCIAPVLIACIIKGAELTIGNDGNVSAAMADMGAVPEYTDNPAGIWVDNANKIVTTPCYMLADNISSVATGALNAVNAAVKLL